MELSLALAQQILSMVLICCVGYILARFNIVSPDQSYILSRVAVYALTPCTIMQSFQSELNHDQLSGLALAFICATVIHLVAIPIMHLLGKAGITSEEKASAVYSNAGNFGIPLISGIASLGAGYVFYMSAFFATQNALLWSHGVTLMSGSAKVDVKKILKNPCMISIAVGLFFFFTQITLPGPIATTVSNLAACLGPICMLVIGLSLGGQDLKSVFSNKRVYGVAALRLLILPAVIMIPFYLLAQVWAHPDIENIIIVMFICALGPAASTVVQLSQIYQSKHIPYVSAINVVSTLLCAVTMPIMVFIFQFFLHM
ncbi:AEC family transporter [Bengtsoniella intestinalis]|uniref:AEC family transporter n=1 Tax=Bengtsoniella intestinalis TaxID=3073143 RepID=UPI00391F3F83